MSQSILIQIGQCGNQIGCRFWDLALREHAANNKAVLVDMEEGVVNAALKGPLGDVFDHKQFITDVSGSGNNWAVGNRFYGRRYREAIVESVRREAEMCDALQCFFVLHSMGGGTGSGVGTAILGMLRDEFPDVYNRFVTAVFPSADDDVITSPYNSILALKQLTEVAECVLPIENQALQDICTRISKFSSQSKAGIHTSAAKIKEGSAVSDSHQGAGKCSVQKAFDSMNNIVANLLLNLTCSARFEGSLNVDLNEISMNLVPFPRLHYLVSSMAPLYSLTDVNIPQRRLDSMFGDAFSPAHQLIRADPKHGLYLACALMVRGKAQLSDVRRNIERIKSSLRFVHWNQEGWKTGLCAVPPTGQPYSLLTLANNTCIEKTFTDLVVRFNRLYKRKAHLHHYLTVDGMEVAEFDDSLQSVQSLIAEYKDLQTTRQSIFIPRLQVAASDYSMQYT
ncbi:PREDICTED: tubulin epsilon chain-like isoform X2 [Priapulus caudatus]|uniref:Tubulin epsilon chain-like isoform X2 n=1 Tax=Priapulus caudatus TaxID=37621 RepID=A0ABM1DQC5_PRICU|nr:PREDICTED: tubulin epsilon chain-like isoform X2 [Priapulus caudatus]